MTHPKNSGPLSGPSLGEAGHGPSLYVTRSPVGYSRDAVTRALQRGVEAGKPGCAIYLPGEEVRCIHPGGRGGGYCAGVLYTNGPESIVEVRVYEVRRFNERRRTARGNYKCQRGDRQGQQHWLEVESVVADPPHTSAAAGS